MKKCFVPRSSALVSSGCSGVHLQMGWQVLRKPSWNEPTRLRPEGAERHPEVRISVLKKPDV